MVYRRRNYRRKYPTRKRTYKKRSYRRKPYVYSKQARKTLPNYKKATVTKNFADLRKCKTAMPNVLMNRLTYQDFLQTAVSTADLSTHVWRLNSINDFDQTGTGSRPPMYGDMYGIYDFSTVKRTRVKLRYNNKNDRAFRVYLICSIDTTSFNDPQSYDLVNHPGFLKYVDVGPVGTPQSQRTISCNVDIYKMYAKLNQPTPLGNTLTNLQATTGNNPVANLFLQVYVQYQDDNPLAAVSYDYSINASFDVLWFRKGITAAVDYD